MEHKSKPSCIVYVGPYIISEVRNDTTVYDPKVYIAYIYDSCNFTSYKE